MLMNTSGGSAYRDEQNVHKTLEDFQAYVDLQSYSIGQLEIDLKKSKEQLKSVNSEFKQTNKKTQLLVNSFMKVNDEIFFGDTPLGLSFKFLSLKDLFTASSVCKLWSRISLDCNVQIHVWTKFLKVYNPELYAKHAESTDKRFLVADGKSAAQLAAYTFRLNKTEGKVNTIKKLLLF